MRTVHALVCYILICGAVGCTRAVSSDPIIEKYRKATCVPPENPRVPGAATRQWNDTLTLDGSKVRVSGAQMVGGRISVQYSPGEREMEADNAGDYIYPSDVRLDPGSDLLYVKASGLAAGIWQETWLFEYDLRGQKLVASRRVRDEVLPPECTEPSRIR